MFLTSKHEEEIRVGQEYQAVIPPLIPVAERKLDQCPDTLLVWSPTTTIADESLDMYINIAKEKYGYNEEQALGMLFWHKHILKNAIDDLPNFTPFPNEWTIEDKVLFEQAFQIHGKCFHRIRQMLPDKSITALVKYYYSWKKTCFMYKRARKLVARSGNSNEEGGTASDAGSEVGSKTVSDSEEKMNVDCDNTAAGNEEGGTASDAGSEVGSNTDSDSEEKMNVDCDNTAAGNEDGGTASDAGLEVGSKTVSDSEEKMNVDCDNTAAGSSAPASPATPKHAAV